MTKAIFLDRDGVINQTIFRMGKPRAPYTLEEFSFIPGVQEAVAQLKHAGFLLIVATNQPDVSRGWVSLEQVNAVNDFVVQELKVDELKACFHTEIDNCACRKPRPGMLLEAAKEWDIRLQESFMVGDRYSDVDAGQRAGCRSILVGPGDENTQKLIPEFTCRDLLEATQWILGL